MPRVLIYNDEELIACFECKINYAEVQVYAYRKISRMVLMVVNYGSSKKFLTVTEYDIHQGKIESGFMKDVAALFENCMEIEYARVNEKELRGRITYLDEPYLDKILEKINAE